VAPFCPSAAYRVLEGRWHASCEAFADAAEHSMMWGGVDLSAWARRVPISMVAGSTSPLQFLLLEAGHEGHGGGGGQEEVSEPSGRSVPIPVTLLVPLILILLLLLLLILLWPLILILPALGSEGRGRTEPPVLDKT